MIYKGPDLSFSSFHIAITFPMNDFPSPNPLTSLILWKNPRRIGSWAVVGNPKPLCLLLAHSWCRISNETLEQRRWEQEKHRKLWLSSWWGSKAIFCLVRSSASVSSWAFQRMWASTFEKATTAERRFWPQQQCVMPAWLGVDGGFLSACVCEQQEKVANFPAGASLGQR